MTTDRMSLSELTRRYHNGTPIRILAELNGCTDKEIKTALNGGGWIKHASLFGHPIAKPEPKPEPTEPLEIPQVLEHRKTKEEEPVEEKKQRKTIGRVKLEKLVAEGKSTSEIAAALGKSYGTIWNARKRYGLLEAAEPEPTLTTPKPVSEPVGRTAPPSRADWQRYRRAQLAEWIQHCAGKGLVIEPEFIAEWNEGVS